MQLRIHNFAREQGMLGQIFAGEYAPFVVFLGLMAKNNDYFVPDINLRIIVIVIFRRGNLIACKDNFSTCIPISTEIKRHEVCALCQFFRLPTGTQYEPTAIAQTCARRDLEILKVAFPSGWSLASQNRAAMYSAALFSSGVPVSRPFKSGEVRNLIWAR